jgi:hypothetical protein
VPRVSWLCCLALFGCPADTVEPLPTPWYFDQDGDGVGKIALGFSYDAPPGGVARGGDCDDRDPDRFPGNPEACDGRDQDCDDVADNGLTFVDWFADDDGDGHGDDDVAVSSCAFEVDGHSVTGDDCDDADFDRYPGNPERCDGVDQDCTDHADDGLPFVDWFVDHDADGHGVPDVAISACDAFVEGFALVDDDCDDTNTDNHPGNTEVCDGRDQDCAEGADNGLAFEMWYKDADGDGHGDDALTAFTCDGAPQGYVKPAHDCDDQNADNFPGNVERCDHVDQDCDDAADNGLPRSTWYADVDDDGFGDALAPLTDCGDAPTGYVDSDADCDDTADAVYPGASVDRCDFVDTDCSGSVEEIRVPHDHATVQAAVDAAADGDRVCVDSGTWGRFRWAGKSLVIEGVDGAVIDAGASTLAVEGEDVGRSTLAGFTLTNALAAAAYVHGGHITLRDLEVTGSTCTGECLGIGLRLTDVDVVLEDVDVYGNRMVNTGANQASGAVAVTRGVVDATGLTIRENRVDGGNAVSGLYLDASTVTATDLDVVSNLIYGVGSGGSAIALRSGSSFDGTRVTVQGNRTDFTGPTSSAVHVTDSDFAVENALIVQNLSGASTLRFERATADLRFVTIAGNAVPGSVSAGHVLSAVDDTTVTLDHAIVSGNVSASAGPSPIVWTDPTVTWSDLVPATEHVGTGGNISADPLFASGAFTLRSSSPARNAGDPAVFDRNGTRADLGAYGGPNAF